MTTQENGQLSHKAEHTQALLRQPSKQGQAKEGIWDRQLKAKQFTAI